MALKWGICLLMLGESVFAVNLDDQAVVDNAADKSAEWCGLASIANVDREEGRSHLEAGAGVDNVMYKALTTNGQVDSALAEVLDPGFLTKKAFPIVLFILILLFFLFCSWCACCKCCRCCKRDRGAPMLVKGGIGLLLAIGVAGFIIVLSMVLGGLGDLSNGIYSTGCASANLLTDVLAGDKAGTFIGILPVVDTFDGMVDMLVPGSDFLNGLEKILDETKDIDKAVTMTTGTVKLLEAALQDATDDSVSGVQTYLHYCLFCERLAPNLGKVVDMLDTGVGATLVKARAEVKDQLTGDKMTELSESLKASLEPLYAFKDNLIATVGVFVTPGQFDSYTKYVQGQSSALGLAVLYALLVLSAILLCGCVSLCCWHFKGKTPDPEPGQNPYRPHAACCACCTWCNGVVYSMLMFLIGGIMVVVAIPLSGLCLVLADMDATLFTSITDSLNLELGDPATTVMVTEMIDRCLSVASAEKYAGQSSNLLDIVKIESNGSYGPVRDQIVALAIDPVNAQFNAITVALGSSPAKLSNVSQLLELRELLNNTPVSALIMPMQDEVEAHPDYKDMWASGVTPMGVVTSMNCDDLDGPSRGFPEDIPGVDSWFTYLSASGTSNAGTCADRTQELTVCTAGPTQAECEAANSFLKEKNKLATNATFKCSLFLDSLGLPCDPKDMYKDSSGTWQGICFDESGKLSIHNVDCDMAAFDNYVRTFDQRFQKVFEYLDDTVADKLEAVNSGLRSYVTSKVLDPMYEVVDKFQCDFMRSFYAGLLDGLCYQGTNGFRKLANGYVLSAFIALIVTIAAFIIFRFAKDNADSWAAKQDPVTI